MMSLLLFAPFLNTIPELLLLFTLSSVPLMYFSWDHPSVLSMEFTLDSMSMMLILLSIWVSLLMILNSSKNLWGPIYILLMILVMFFSTMNLLSFFILFESSLLPTMALILGWGYQPERIQATKFFFFYTVFFSGPLLVMLIWLMFKNEVYSLSNLSSINSNLYTFYMLLVFMMKAPIFIGHFWLPKAHVEAPVVGSMILAGVLLKMGGYGIIRFSDSLTICSIKYIFFSTGAVGMVFTCFMCLSGFDMKQIVAYSSISHMNFMILGLMLPFSLSYTGGMILMVSHGLSSSCMFMLADFAYKRTHTRSLLFNKGMIMVNPLITLGWFLLSLFNMSFPPTLGCISELMIIMTSQISTWFVQVLVVMYLFLSAFYTIYLYIVVSHGKLLVVTLDFNSLSVKEKLLMILHITPLVLGVLLINTMTL